MNHERKTYERIIEEDTRAAIFLAEKARAWRMAIRYFWVVAFLGALVGNVIGHLLSFWLFN